MSIPSQPYINLVNAHIQNDFKKPVNYEDVVTSSELQYSNSHFNVTLDEYSKNIGELKVNKIKSFGKAIYAGVFKYIGHLFIAGMDQFVGMKEDVKADFYSARRDLQEAKGYFVSLWNPKKGIYEVEFANFMKNCYQIYVKKPIRGTNPLVQEKIKDAKDLLKKQLINALPLAHWDLSEIKFIVFKAKSPKLIQSYDSLPIPKFNDPESFADFIVSKVFGPVDTKGNYFASSKINSSEKIECLLKSGTKKIQLGVTLELKKDGPEVRSHLVSTSPGDSDEKTVVRDAFIKDLLKAGIDENKINSLNFNDKDYDAKLLDLKLETLKIDGVSHLNLAQLNELPSLYCRIANQKFNSISETAPISLEEKLSKIDEANQKVQTAPETLTLEEIELLTPENLGSLKQKHPMILHFLSLSQIEQLFDHKTDSWKLENLSQSELETIFLTSTEGEKTLYSLSTPNLLRLLNSGKVQSILKELPFEKLEDLDLVKTNPDMLTQILSENSHCCAKILKSKESTQKYLNFLPDGSLKNIPSSTLNSLDYSKLDAPKVQTIIGTYPQCTNSFNAMKPEKIQEIFSKLNDDQLSKIPPKKLDSIDYSEIPEDAIQRYFGLNSLFKIDDQLSKFSRKGIANQFVEKLSNLQLVVLLNPSNIHLLDFATLEEPKIKNLFSRLNQETCIRIFKKLKPEELRAISSKLNDRERQWLPIPNVIQKLDLG